MFYNKKRNEMKVLIVFLFGLCILFSVFITYITYKNVEILDDNGIRIECNFGRIRANLNNNSKKIDNNSIALNKVLVNYMVIINITVIIFVIIIFIIQIDSNKGLEDSNEKFKSIFHESPIGICIFDNNGDFISANKAAYGIFNKCECMPLERINLFEKNDIFNGEILKIKMDKSVEFTIDIDLKDSTNEYNKSIKGHFQVIVKPLSKSGRFLTQIQDITEIKEKEEHILKLAYMDGLTGIANRKNFDLMSMRILKFSKENNKKFSVVYMDLDKFKSINDLYGHKAGDDLLIQVAKILRNETDLGDLVARIGGDEFVIILSNIKSKKDVINKVKNILLKFKDDFCINGTHVSIKPSMGISMYPKDGQSIEELLIKADNALYEVKKSGGYMHKFYNK